MKKTLLFILLPFAWMAKVGAQTSPPTIDGYFNPIGNYEYGYQLEDGGWSSHINGWHYNADQTVTVFTNFDTLAGQKIGYAFVLDGENWYPATAREGTFGIIENAIDDGDWYTYGEEGVFNSQGACMLPIENGTYFVFSYVDPIRHQVVLIKKIPYDPLNGLWEDDHDDIIIWDGTNAETVGTGMVNITCLIPTDSGNSLLIGANSLDAPCLFKLDLVERMMVEPDENLAAINYPAGASQIYSGLIWNGAPTISGHYFGYGDVLTQNTEAGWEENIVSMTSSLLMYQKPGTSELFLASDEVWTDDAGSSPQWLSGMATTTDLVNFTPLVDKRNAYIFSGYDAIPFWTKGAMWIIGKRHNSCGLGAEEDERYYDVYVLKDTYTPYTTGVNDEQVSQSLVYPNPATEFFNYNLPISAELISLEGKIVKTIYENEKYVDVSDIPSGIYILTIKDGSTSKVVITH